MQRDGEGRRELKMWLAVRTDLTMPAAKLGVQAGHGFLSCFLAALERDPERARAYVADDQPKILVRVKSEAELDRVAREANAAGIPFAIITDRGRTVFSGPTKTVCAFGPCYREDLTAFLRRLRLLESLEDAA